MATMVIPQSQIESLRGSAGDFVWPEGAYEATMESFTVKDLPSTQSGDPFAGYETTDGTLLTIRLGSIQPLEEGMGEVGNRKIFVDIVISDGEHTLQNVDVSVQGAAYWQIQKSAKMVGNLALALGAVDFVGEDVEVQDGFLDALVNGEYTGQRIGFVLFNRKGKNGKSYEQIETFVGA